jgi:drug/metabolite transporter (DMT)-like permease
VFNFSLRLRALSSLKLGSLWMLVGGFCFAVMGALVKTASIKFTSPELVFYRGILGVALVYWFVHQHQRSLRTSFWGKQASRAIIGFIATVFFFYALGKLPLATATTLNQTSPLFMAMILPFVLHQPAKKTLIFAIILGFVGVTLLLKPSIHVEQLSAGAIGLLSGLLAGVVYVHVTLLARAGEPDWRTVFYFSLACALGGFIWMLFYEVHIPTLKDLPVLLGIGLATTLGQLAMTRAYRTGNPLVVGSLAYSTVVFSSLLGWLYWQELLTSGEWFAIGLIFLSGVISIRAAPKSNQG